MVATAHTAMVKSVRDIPEVVSTGIFSIGRQFKTAALQGTKYGFLKAGR